MLQCQPSHAVVLTWTSVQVSARGFGTSSPDSHDWHARCRVLLDSGGARGSHETIFQNHHAPTASEVPPENSHPFQIPVSGFPSFGLPPGPAGTGRTSDKETSSHRMIVCQRVHRALNSTTKTTLLPRIPPFFTSNPTSPQCNHGFSHTESALGWERNYQPHGPPTVIGCPTATHGRRY